MLHKVAFGSSPHVSRQAAGGEGIDRLRQTDVGLQEVLDGLIDGDLRVRDALLAIAGA